MKRIVLLFTLLVMFPLMGNAQLKVKGKTAKIETIVSARAGFLSLKHDGSSYYIVTNTTNQFDDPFILYVGDDKESALQTLTDLYNLCGNIEDGTSVVIDNLGEECRIYGGIMGTLSIQSDDIAGMASLAKSELNKMIKALTRPESNQKFKDGIYQ